MSRKNIIPAKTLVSAAAISAAADYESSSTNVLSLDRVSYQVVFTGTCAGTLYIDGSVDGTSYVPLDMDAMAINGADTVICDIQVTGLAHLKVRYTHSSGSGTWTVKVAGKAS